MEIGGGERGIVRLSCRGCGYQMDSSCIVEWREWGLRDEERREG